MKIFCIGLSRTGTASLTNALDLLGFNAFHFPHIYRVFGNIHIRKKFYHYDALSDTPVALNYKKLDKRFPNSKFILTTREKGSWLHSCAEYPAFQRASSFSKQKKFRLLRKKLYGSICFDHDAFSKAYDKHHSEVMLHFAGRENDLLKIDVTNGEGWNKLCQFLNMQIPDVDFPRVNTLDNLGWRKIATPKQMY